MLGWSFAFFIAAIVAAMFGFGHIASTFAGIAVILFWVFVALFVISLLFALLGGRTLEGRPYVSNGVPAVVLIAGLAVLAYAWVKNDWSAERVGRAIDQSAQNVSTDARQALNEAGDRARKLSNDTQHDLTHPSDHNDHHN